MFPVRNSFSIKIFMRVLHGISWISSDFGSELSATHASLFQWLILKSERGVPSIISGEQLQFFHASHARLHAQSHWNSEECTHPLLNRSIFYRLFRPSQRIDPHSHSKLSFLWRSLRFESPECRRNLCLFLLYSACLTHFCVEMRAWNLLLRI